MIEAFLVIIIFLLLIVLKVLVDLERKVDVYRSNSKLTLNILQDFIQDTMDQLDVIEAEISRIKDKLV